MSDIIIVENNAISTVDTDRRSAWAEAFQLWLSSFQSPSTRRAYQDAWRDLVQFLGDVQPWRLGRSDLARWVADLRTRGLSDCTRNQHIAGISSFFRYCMTEYTVTSPDGREVPLHYFNPAAGRSLRAHITRMVRPRRCPLTK